MWVYSLLSLAVLSVLQSSNAAKSLWNHDDWKNREVESYLLDSEFSVKNEGTEFIKDIMRVIHANQHPKKEDCRSRRLLVLHMHTDSLEGLCSLTKQVVMGLATAMHSNRTLVWGASPPFLIEETREIWAGQHRENIDLGGAVVNCPSDESGGPYGCFFEQLSTCTLSDVSDAELVEISTSPYSDTARVKIMDTKQNQPRSISLYFPPQGLVDHVISKEPKHQPFKATLIDRSSHLWAGSVSAYVFRIRPEIVQSFSNRYGKHFVSNDPVWGMHVRHGDVKSQHYMIKQKRVFTFESYFAVARDLSNDLKSSPALLFVSTDSDRADKVPEMFANFEKNSEEALDEDEEDEDFYDDQSEHSLNEDDEHLKPVHRTWYEAEAPDVLVVSSKERYRTEHGFIVAASESCINNPTRVSKDKKVCAIPFQNPVSVDGRVYDGAVNVLEVPRPIRLMKLMLEGIEDIFLLSVCDKIIAQGSSHFSTLSIVLMWARTGCSDTTNSVKLLDEKTFVTGDSAAAFLQGTNLWNSSYSGPGPERWSVLTNRFISGLPSSPARRIRSVKLDFDPWSPTLRMGIWRGIPKLPDKIFYREARLWLGGKSPVWPGGCPDSLETIDLSTDTLFGLVNLGVDHYQVLHGTEAMKCWQVALALTRAINIHDAETRDMVTTVVDVLVGNLQNLAQGFRVYAEIAALKKGLPLGKAPEMQQLKQIIIPDDGFRGRVDDDDEDDYDDEEFDMHFKTPSKAASPTSSRTTSPPPRTPPPPTAPSSKSSVNEDDEYDDDYDGDIDIPEINVKVDPKKKPQRQQTPPKSTKKTSSSSSSSTSSTSSTSSSKKGSAAASDSSKADKNKKDASSTASSTIFKTSAQKGAAVKDKKGVDAKDKVVGGAGSKDKKAIVEALLTRLVSLEATLGKEIQDIRAELKSLL